MNKIIQINMISSAYGGDSVTIKLLEQIVGAWVWTGYKVSFLIFQLKCSYFCFHYRVTSCNLFWLKRQIRGWILLWHSWNSSDTMKCLFQWQQPTFTTENIHGQWNLWPEIEGIPTGLINWWAGTGFVKKIKKIGS